MGGYNYVSTIIKIVNTVQTTFWRIKFTMSKLSDSLISMNHVFVITGPSGVGKTHLAHELSKRGLYLLKVYTDRAPRHTEQSVTDRVYITKKEFDKHSAEDFAYWFEFQDNRYGYMRNEINANLNSNKNMVTNIIPSCVSDFVKSVPQTVVIYLNIGLDKFDLLKKRMIKREISKNDTKEEKLMKNAKIEKRLEFARNELTYFDEIINTSFVNSLSKVFNILDDSTLYKEVIPYIVGCNRYSS